MHISKLLNCFRFYNQIVVVRLFFLNIRNLLEKRNEFKRKRISSERTEEINLKYHEKELSLSLFDLEFCRKKDDF